MVVCIKVTCETMSEEKICRTCSFYDSFVEGSGECRRYAPVVKFVQKETKAAFPVIGSADWCGEWSSNSAMLPQFGRMTKARKEAMKNDQ